MTTQRKRSLSHPAHKGTLWLKLLTAMATLGVLPAQTALAQGTAAPRMVVSILVDQLRSDYLQAFLPLYGEDGIRRLLRQGRVYTQAEYPHAGTDRAAAAATVATGAMPSDHGIVAMEWLDRETLRPVFCVDDKDTQGVGSLSPSSPHRLLVTTVGDELKVATEGKAMVYAIAPFRDAAVIAGGHAADGAYWIDETTGRWCTSSYYGTLPAWLSVRNSESRLANQQGQVWQPSSMLVGTFNYFLSRGVREPFSHRFEGMRAAREMLTTALVNDEMAAAAGLCIEKSRIGADDTPDFLALTLYAGSYLHKPVNDAAMEMQDTYVRLDRAIASILAAIEKKVGTERALVVLTSTGTSEEEAGDLSAYRIPSGTFDTERAAGLLNMYLAALHGQGKYALATNGTQFYFDRKLIEDKALTLSAVLDEAAEFLQQLSGVKDVYTSSRLIQGAWTPGISAYRAAYHTERSGDLRIVLSPGWKLKDNTSTQIQREGFVPFPIIYYGGGTTAETVGTPVTTDHIAPTLCEAIRIRAPNACAAKPQTIR
ncbi:MAG: alkaline phosphatase family protein [Bacteroidaceae bacterium]|nr:alkaline phosphatase family protein [Bacteroidaceae bacterium]